MAWASGKVILFGEHAVVYGAPAIAGALSLGLHFEARPCQEGPGLRLRLPNGAVVTSSDAGPIAEALRAALRWSGRAAAGLSLTLSGDLPLGVGLGSSAAFAVALCRTLAASAPTPLPIEVGAEAIERVFHGQPSGLDHQTILSGGLLHFEAGQARPLKLAAPLEVALAWIPRQGQTRDLVEGLRARRATHPEVFAPLLATFRAVAEAGARALEAGDTGALPTLFDLNHGLLSACGVSTAKIEALVYAARARGAGAKLTGAGGGGAVIAIGGALAPIVEAWRALGAEAAYAQLGLA